MTGKQLFGASGLIALLITGFTLVSTPLIAQPYIADHTIAKEEVLRKIPLEYINKARTGLVIAYQHTSHGTHVSRGVFGLQDYKTGDTLLFGVSLTQDSAKLEFRDNALAEYAPPRTSAVDLSDNETAFIQTTRNYLDAPENATVNVVMWSWCNIDGRDAEGNYLPGMDSLISEYGPGGSKIGTGVDQRELPVSFIFMTAHANEDANLCQLCPEPQATMISDSCKAHQQFCLDYYSIDTHDMDKNYYEDAGDDGDSNIYGGNFYADWQDSMTLGEHYYENKIAPGGDVAFGDHNTQHITANRKAYAMWWILARIAGWDGDTAAPVLVTEIQLTSEGAISEIETGAKLQFSASVLPENASNKELFWSVTDSSGTSTISDGGLLTAGSPCSISVVATATDGTGVWGFMDITIIDPAVFISGITISSAGNVSELEKGMNLQFSVEIIPMDATNSVVEWSVIAGTGSASITQDGLLSAVNIGVVDVLASAVDGSGVSDIFGVVILPVTGLSAYVWNSGSALYPNPGEDLFYLDVGDIPVEMIEVVGPDGSLVFQQVPDVVEGIIELKLAGLGPGLYFIKAFSGDRFIVERAIISR